MYEEEKKLKNAKKFQLEEKEEARLQEEEDRRLQEEEEIRLKEYDVAQIKRENQITNEKKLLDKIDMQYKEKFDKMRIAGKLAAQTLDMLKDNIEEGISTDHIDKLGYEFIRDNGGYSAPLYYRGFTKSLCTSLNHVVCHGIPSDRTLRDGDAINIDVTAVVNEYYGDTSRMFCIGKTPVKLSNLIDTTYHSMMRAIKILKP